MTIETVVVGGLHTNCYLVYDEALRAAVIDPGGQAEKLLERIRALGLDVQWIMITHGHFDHVLALPELKRATGAQVAISKEDAPLIYDENGILVKQMRVRLEPVIPDRTMSDGEAITVGDLTFRWIFTPGHSPGSMTLLCGTAMFSGDTLFEGDCGRTDLPGGDRAQILRSLKKLYDLEGDYTVYPGHDVSTTLSRERQYNRDMLAAVAGTPE